jgi:hypothetical protein
MTNAKTTQLLRENNRYLRVEFTLLTIALTMATLILGSCFLML